MYAEFYIHDKHTIRVSVFKGDGPKRIGSLEVYIGHASEMFCDIGEAYVWLSKQGVLPQKVKFIWGETK
jgi:hypothetical protein